MSRSSKKRIQMMLGLGIDSVHLDELNSSRRFDHFDASIDSPLTIDVYPNFDLNQPQEPALPETLHAFGIDTEELELSTAVQTQVQLDNGLPLWKALQESPFLYRAGRAYTATAVLLTDGRRFWTADLNCNGMYTEELTLPIRQDEPIWRPVIGSEKGWRLA